jgi:hypothetical protein
MKSDRKVNKVGIAEVVESNIFSRVSIGLSGSKKKKKKKKKKNLKFLLKKENEKGKKELIIFICLRLVSIFRVFFGQAIGVHII